MRELTKSEIKRFASRKGVRKMAVENFLSSMPSDPSDALRNLEYDARLYNWNAATEEAIRDGILKASGAERFVWNKEDMIIINPDEKDKK